MERPAYAFLCFVLTGLTCVSIAATEIAVEEMTVRPAVDPLDREAEEAADDDPGNHDDPFVLGSWLQPEPIVPEIMIEPGITAPGLAEEFAARVFAGQAARRSLLPERRRARLLAPGSDIVLGADGRFRAASDAGSLLGKTRSASGVGTQKRSGIVTEPRIRGDRIGRLVASGSYWFPARQDLDTMVSKFDSRIISDVIVIKGPYSVRYGPGFDFVDFQLLPAPRYEGGPGWEASTSLEYLVNGQQWYGRQWASGGSDYYGYRVGYGHRTGNDYETGSGSELPTSYNSRDIDVALGYDLTPDSHLEFSYLRLDQTGVEYPGLVFDMNALVTDGFSLTYVLENQAAFDLLTVETWYNATRFGGDTSRSGKNIQIPSLKDQLAPFNGQGLAVTDVDAYSSGYRAAVTWGQPSGDQITLGSDFIYLGQQLNDIEDPQGDPRNYPIPRSHSPDVGIFVERVFAYSDRLRFNTAARCDFVSADARDDVPFFYDFTFQGFTSISEMKQSGLERDFTLWSLYATAEYRINDCWTLTAGAGHGQRPPSLTELYATGSFIGSLQPGLTFLEGDPQLDPERRTQIDVALTGDLGRTRILCNGFHAWINDYITYEAEFSDAFFPYEPGTDFQPVVYTNTDLAILAGVELAAEYDLRPGLTTFALMGYVGGRDLTRNEPSRLAQIRREPFVGPPPFFPFDGNESRSVADSEEEPLPGIPPLEARVGLRWYDPSPIPSWGLELESRIVDHQERVATSLFEQPTSGFTVWNIRGFWQPCETLSLTAGVENFTNKFYREHLDYRSGLGVFRPGVTFYFGSQLDY